MPESPIAPVISLAEHRTSGLQPASPDPHPDPESFPLLTMAPLVSYIVAPHAAAAGETILDVAQTGEYLAALTSGVVLEQAMYDGHMITTEVCTAGDFLGWLEPGRQPSGHHYVTSTDSATYSLIPRAALVDAVKNNAQAAMALMRSEIRRREALQRRLMAVNTLRPAVRFARSLLDLDSIYAAAGFHPLHTIPLTQRDLGSLAGVSHSSSHTLIATFRVQKILAAHRASIEILDFARLRAVAEVLR